MRRVVIVNPAAAHGIYGPLGEDLIAVEPPQWVRLIAGYLRDHGAMIRIIDAEAEGLKAPIAAERIARGPATDLVCIAVYGHQPSASTQQMFGAGALARALKAKGLKAPIIMVGGHPSALPEQTLAEEAIDYVGIGEGHLTVAGLLRGDDPAKIPGLGSRVGPQVAWINRAPPLCEDLRELHGHVWDHLPMKLYRAHNWQCFGDLGSRQPYASIYTSLGCPYKCEFCCINAPFESNRYRMRRPQDVVDEIQYLHEEHGVATFKITDEMFVLNTKHYTAICNELIRRELGRKLNIWAYARVDTVDPGTVELLSAAGIRWLALGIESGSEHVRDGAKKRLKTNDIVGTVKLIQSLGVNVIGNFMFGLRDDTAETIQQTLDLALECLPDFANFYATMAYPGSALYKQAVSEGWTLPASWRGYSQHNDDCRPLDTEHLDGRQVLAFRDAAFTRFFTDDRYRAHVADKFGTETLAHVDQMVAYKLPRKLLEGESDGQEARTQSRG